MQQDSLFDKFPRINSMNSGLIFTSMYIFVFNLFFCFKWAILKSKLSTIDAVKHLGTTSKVQRTQLQQISFFLSDVELSTLSLIIH